MDYKNPEKLKGLLEALKHLDDKQLNNIAETVKMIYRKMPPISDGICF